jgi:thiamine biosynthesis lipoprotein
MDNFQLNFEAIGTRWVIDCWKSPISSQSLLKIIIDRVEEFDKTYSRFRKDSVVWQASEKEGKYIFPPDSKELFALYDKFYKVTQGAFTLLIGNTLSEAGYDSTYSLIPKKLNEVPDISSIYSFDYPALTVKKPYILDFGGLGKGYLVDIISNLLIEEGVDSFCVDGGGDMHCYNLENPLKVGLENPLDTKQVIGVVEINNKSLCASSGNRRKWANFHHIIDPRNLESPNEILATWVIAKDTITADGLATSLFFTTPTKLTKYFDFEYLVLFPDFTVRQSKNFSSELFLK